MSTRDIVIVGHGAAGLAAAIAARQESTRLGNEVRVHVIERSRIEDCGGNTRWSPAYMRMASTAALAPGFEDDLIAVSGGHADRDYVRTLATRAPETVQWITELGIGFHRPVYYLAEGPPRIQPVGGGSALVNGLTDAARAHGIRFRYGCTAQSLVRASGAAVHGLIVNEMNEVNEVLEDDAADEAQRAQRVHTDHPAPSSTGTHAQIDAAAIILASGGFAGSPRMLYQHFGDGGESMQPISPGTRFGTGDGIRMALAIGARRSGDWQGMHAEPVDARSRQSAPVVLVYPYGIVVDRTGQRFFDEGAGLVHETWETFARQIQFELPGRRAFAVLDSRLFSIAGYERAIRSELPPLQADTLDALAALAGIDAAGLQATITAYNRAATGDARRFDATRVDGLRAADGLVPPKSNWARPIDQPPYLAYPLAGAIAYTFGGLATDSHARVLEKTASDGSGDAPAGAGGAHAIPGLFAAGEITGHFYRLAPNAVAVMRALVFGRIAGINAARYVAGLSDAP